MQSRSAVATLSLLGPSGKSASQSHGHEAELLMGTSIRNLAHLETQVFYSGSYLFECLANPRCRCWEITEEYCVSGLTEGGTASCPRGRDTAVELSSW